MVKKYRVALVGVGVVGQQILLVLKSRNFPASSILLVGRTAREEEFFGETYRVQAVENVDWQEVDIALFAGTEGEKGASTLYGWKAVEAGAVVVDNGDDFRMDDRVPLVIPEINSQDIKTGQGFVANPNCSTIQMALALWPLHQSARLKEVVVSTYQAVSGSGSGGIFELQEQTQAVMDKKEVPKPAVYPHPIAFNVIPQISSLRDDFPGYYKEEIKMLLETRKIFHAPSLAVTATCARVPVIHGHSEAITARFEREITPEEARKLLRATPGIEVVDDPAHSTYPMAQNCVGRDPVYVGRIRQSILGKDTLEMWVVSDNIHKGAALNAVQIAEKMVEMELV